MTAEHWADHHVAWLRYHVPELGDDPVYIRRNDELHGWMDDETAMAWSEASGDLKIRDLLSARDEWQGRGYFIAVRPMWHDLPWMDQRGVLIHELAHSLCQYDSLTRIHDEADFTELERTLLQPGGADVLIAKYGLPQIDYEKAHRRSHGSRWVRCCMHLWARFAYEIELGAVRVFTGRYVLDWDSSDEVLQALLPEIRKGGHLIDVLKSPEPPQFAALFEGKY